MPARLPCLHILLHHTFHLLVACFPSGCPIQITFLLFFFPLRICKLVSHCPSLHQLCQHLCGDGHKNQTKLNQQLFFFFFVFISYYKPATYFDVQSADTIR